MPLRHALLRRARPNLFIETGTDRGAGAEMADLMGFHQVWTIEHDPRKFAEAETRFQGHRYITPILGESPAALRALLATHDGPFTFWLDAHGDCTPTGPSPVLDELAVILMDSALGRHVVLIDDLRMFRERRYVDRDGHPITVEALTTLVQHVRPDCTPTIEDGDGAVGDILAIGLEPDRP